MAKVIVLIVAGALAFALLLAGCSEEPTPGPTASPTPTATPTPAPPLDVYETGQTIPDFSSSSPIASSDDVSRAIRGGNVVIGMANRGTVRYSHATYTCVSREGCGIENGRVTVGVIQVADPSAVTSPTSMPAAVPTAVPTLEPIATATPALPLNVYESGQTIPDFPSSFPNAVRGGASLEIRGGNVVIRMANGGTVEYSHATYTCVSAEGCGIENGRVTVGVIRVADPSAVESPAPIPTAIPTLEPIATATPIPIATATPIPTATPTPEPTATPTPFPTATPTPAGPVVDLNDIECNITQEYIAGSYYSNEYAVTGEVHANRHIENVQVGFGVGNFSALGFGDHIYTGFPGDSESLGSMSAGESKSFRLFFVDLTSDPTPHACRIEVVWTQPR